MNIDRLEVGFTDIVNIGRYAYFIYCNKNGVFVNTDEIFENAQSFNRVVFLGGEPLLQKEELSRLSKKLVKINPRIVIEIFTKGLIKPTEVTGYINNTVFNVIIPTKETNGYKIDMLILNWFSEVGSNFIFDINNLDDIDNVITLINGVGIKKQQVFLSPLQHIDNLNRHIKFYGINLAPKVEWENEE
jgi:organic radical activating enzyme